MSTATKSDGPVKIKKYANRRLYNTGTSTYVTLEDLATMVKSGEDFAVEDAKTGEDITRSVLTQIIFEQENKEGAQNLLPINFLRQLIRFYGDSMQMLVPRYLETSIDSLTREQQKFRDQMSQAFGVSPFGALDEDRAAQHGSVPARLLDVHAVRAARGRRRRRKPKSRHSSGGELDELASAIVRDAEEGRQAEQRREVGEDLARRGLRAVLRPRPLQRSAADQVALQIVAAPAGKHRGGLLVLHPFGDRLEPERARQARSACARTRGRLPSASGSARRRRRS